MFSTKSPPFIVAELSGNHQGSLEKALQVVEAAAEAGVHAIKLQTYTPDTITLDMEFTVGDSPWAGKKLYDLYKEAYTPWEWHKPIFDRARELGLISFSTPFDETAVDYLEELNVPCYKIASLEIVDIPLIKKAASTGKPLIISTGGATEEEISEAVKAAKDCEIILLKCTAAYPAEALDANLRTLPDMAAKFNTLVGLSDHTLGLAVPLASIALGACLIEKHITLSRKEGGVDSSFSLEPHEFKLLVTESKRAWEALGKIKYGPSESERSVLALRPSLFFVEDLPSGTVIEAHHIKSLRPNLGLPPKEQVIGKTLKMNIKKGTPLKWDLIE